MLCIETPPHPLTGSKVPPGCLALRSGSGTCKYFDVEKVAKALRLPQNCVPSEIIAFGYPENEPKRKDKKSINELSFYNYYSKNER